MTLGEMKAQFTSLMNRTDLRNNTSLVSTFIDQAIMRIQRDLRVPMMEKSILATVGTSYNGLSIPGDLLELIALTVDSDADGSPEYQLQRAELTTVKTLAQTIGSPRKYARQGSKWFLGPRPAAGDRVRIDYYANFPDFASDSDSNVLSEVAWDAVVYGALSAACDYYNDERLTNFEARYTQIIKALQEQADSDELSSDAAVAPVYSWPSED